MNIMKHCDTSTSALQSLIDREGLAAINKVAKATKQAVNAGNFEKATELWNTAEKMVENCTHGVNFYNILKWQADQKKNYKHRSTIGGYSIKAKNMALFFSVYPQFHA